MVETIAPVVHGDRRNLYRASIALHVVGATLAAATVGGALAAAGFLLGAPWGPGGAIVVASAALLYWLREFGGVPIPILQRRAQVPEWWRNFFSPPVASTLYGLGLGLGFLTHLTFGTYCVVAIAAISSGEPLLGALVCAPFGAARGLSITVARRAHDEDAVSCVLDDLERTAGSRIPRALNVAMLTAVAVAALLSL